MQNILIVGGSGYLGKNIVLELLSQGYSRIVVLDKINSYNLQNNVAIIFYQCNLTDVENIIRIITLEQITVVIHCISSLIPGSDADQYISDISQVMIPSIKLIDFCAKNNVKFVYLSSGGTIYGNKQNELNEQEPPSPISLYGLSKQKMEDIILFYHRRDGLNYLILRPSNPYGYGQNLNGKQGIIAVFIGKLLRNEPVIIYGDGSIVRDYIYIEDFTYYITELINMNIINMIINIGSGLGYSINEVVSCLETISDRKLNIEFGEARKDDVMSVILDITKLNSLIPHKQKTIQEGMEIFYRKVKADFNLC
jgi:UDP-glucose 4-epimerase